MLRNKSFEYSLSKVKRMDETGAEYSSFDISVFADGEFVSLITDAFTDETKAERFVRLCNNQQLDPVHLDYVLEEFGIQ